MNTDSLDGSYWNIKAQHGIFPYSRELRKEIVCCVGDSNVNTIDNYGRDANNCYHDKDIMKWSLVDWFTKPDGYISYLPPPEQMRSIKTPMRLLSSVPLELHDTPWMYFNYPEPKDNSMEDETSWVSEVPTAKRRKI